MTLSKESRDPVTSACVRLALEHALRRDSVPGQRCSEKAAWYSGPQKLFSNLIVVPNTVASQFKPAWGPVSLTTW